MPDRRRFIKNMEHRPLTFRDERWIEDTRTVAHGQGRAGLGSGHQSSIPPPATDPRARIIEGGVDLQGRAPAPNPARPQAAASGLAAELINCTPQPTNITSIFNKCTRHTSRNNCVLTRRCATIRPLLHRNMKSR